MDLMYSMDSSSFLGNILTIDTMISIHIFVTIFKIFSLVELSHTYGDDGGGSSLSVLRTFRVLRLIKLVRFMPTLRRQLAVMLRTVDNVAVFFVLFCLFVFIFRYLLLTRIK